MTQNLDMFEMWNNYFNHSSTLIDEKMKEQFPSQAMGHRFWKQNVKANDQFLRTEC